jgi:hypothetical protein
MDKNKLIEISQKVIHREETKQNKKLEKAIKERKSRLEQLIKNCDATMYDAANRGKRYCEVSIEDVFYNDLAAHYKEFSPKLNGDGYGERVICLSW